MKHSLVPILLAGLALAPGCGSSDPVSTGPSPQFPGASRSGVAADYVVVQRTGTDVMSVVPLVEAEAVLSPDFQRVGGAVVVYPDGSRQTAAPDGVFDASQSSYASLHPQSLAGALEDVSVTIQPPPGSSLTPLETVVFAPSAATEDTLMSGVIPPDAVPEEQPREASGYVWPDTQFDYLAYVKMFSPTFGARSYWIAPRSFAGPPYYHPLPLPAGGIENVVYDIENKAVWYRPELNVAGQAGQEVPVDQVARVISWTSLDHHVRWTVTLTAQPSARTQVVASWTSPNAYFFAGNVHLTLVQVQAR